MILNKRILRNLKSNFTGYFIIFLLVIMSGFLVVSFGGTTYTVRNSVQKSWKASNVEDGEFVSYSPISNENLNKLKNKGVKIEKTFYMDIEANNGSIVRIFKNRDDINKIQIINGKGNPKNNEIELEYTFANFMKVKTGDEFTIGKDNFMVKGLCSAADYAHRVANISDTGTDAKFGIAFVSSDTFNKIVSNKKYGKKLVYNYTYLLHGKMTDAQLKNWLKKLKIDQYMDKTMNYKLPVLKSFQARESNSRIIGIIKYNESMLSYAIMAGILLTVIIAYILAVFASSNIEKESTVIGAIFALGYLKKELIRHYMILPIIIVMIGSVVGTVLGINGITWFVATSYSYPPLVPTVTQGLITYSIVLPIILVSAINYFILNHELGQEPLSMMRNEKKAGKISNINLQRFKFISMYRIRQLLRESRSYLIMFFGMGVAIIFMMLGFALYGTINHYASKVSQDMEYKNMYILTNPLQKQPKKTEIGLTNGYTIFSNQAGTDMDVVLQGIKSKSKYFNFSNKLKNNDNLIYVSDSAVVKFGYKVGDKVTLTDKLNNKDYTFTIAGEVPFKNGIYFFMNINAMRKHFNIPNDYYNTLFSNEKIKVDDNMLINTISRTTVEQTAQSWLKDAKKYMVMFFIISIISFVLVTYLLMRNILDRATFGISLIKIFGFNKGEIKNMYLGSAKYAVIAALIIFIPISAVLMNYAIPSLNAAMNSGMANFIYPITYVIIIAITFVTYFAVMFIFDKKIDGVDLAEILKNRE
ncbi:FtsX-like permease family protein [Clostridium hydrogenum]|uniref:FtsX-like permease family protein n=1 Tax=Clostridium hydrogenum TaxID=2855764 RepID=UPI001F159858|nr:FtsX-like permease family protein [Clostridium hydrogenum]